MKTIGIKKATTIITVAAAIAVGAAVAAQGIFRPETNLNMFTTGLMLRTAVVFIPTVYLVYRVAKRAEKKG